jgi:hypothetical protein
MPKKGKKLESPTRPPKVSAAIGGATTSKEVVPTKQAVPTKALPQRSAKERAEKEMKRIERETREEASGMVEKLSEETVKARDEKMDNIFAGMFMPQLQEDYFDQPSGVRRMRLRQTRFTMSVMSEVLKSAMSAIDDELAENSAEKDWALEVTRADADRSQISVDQRVADHLVDSATSPVSGGALTGYWSEEL